MGNVLELEKRDNLGNEITIELEGYGDFRITCTACKHDKFHLNFDETVIYCARCRSHIGFSIRDHIDMSNIKWKL